MNDNTPRWVYRFQNFQRAYSLLKEALEQERPLTSLEKEGVVQRFEYTLELAWKTLKDYLEGEAVVLSETTPRAVLRQGFEAGILKQGEVWQKALDARNLMFHTYNLEDFETVITGLRQSFFAALTQLLEFFLSKSPGKPL